MKSQNEAILAFMRKGYRGVTPIFALREFGCFRLSARIYQIKKQLLKEGTGERIVKETVHRGRKHYASYRIEKAGTGCRK